MRDSDQADPEALLSARIRIERKQFFFDLRENPRGRFLKITEDVGGRRDTIIIPSSGFGDFRAALEEVMSAEVKASPMDVASGVDYEDNEAL